MTISRHACRKSSRFSITATLPRQPALDDLLHPLKLERLNTDTSARRSLLIAARPPAGDVVCIHLRKATAISLRCSCRHAEFKFRARSPLHPALTNSRRFRPEIHHSALKPLRRRSATVLPHETPPTTLQGPPIAGAAAPRPSLLKPTTTTATMPMRAKKLAQVPILERHTASGVSSPNDAHIGPAGTLLPTQALCVANVRASHHQHKASVSFNACTGAIHHFLAPPVPEERCNGVYAAPH